MPEVVRPRRGKAHVLGGRDVDPPTPSPIVLVEPEAAVAMMWGYERLVGGRSAVAFPGREVFLDGRHQIDRATALPRPLAILEPVQLTVGVGDLDEECAVTHGVPVQRERLLRS